MTKYFCNPINFSYNYQFSGLSDDFSLNREAADPSIVLFKGKYYLFPSMAKGFLVNEDLVIWKKFPNVRVIGEYLYFFAYLRTGICDFYRTKDPESGEF